MLTQKQAALFWRSLAAAAERQAVPDREAYRKRILREECGVEHLRDVDRTEGFDRLMLRLAQDAEDWHGLSYYSVAGERRLADLVADCATQVLELSPGLGVHPMAYVSGILNQSGMSPIRVDGGDYWLDLAPDDLARLLQILDTHRRRLLKRAHYDQNLAYVHGHRWIVDTCDNRVCFEDPPAPQPAFKVNILSGHGPQPCSRTASSIVTILVLLSTLCAGLAPAETREDLYWRLHRERNATTRYGAPPTAGTNEVDQADSGGSEDLGDLVVTFDNFEISAYSHVGPISGGMRFTVPFETAQGWTGYVLEGHAAPTDIGGVMSEEYAICDPATGGNLVMMWNYGSEFLSIDGLYTAAPSVKNYFGEYSGTISFARAAPGPAVPTTVLPFLDRETVREMLAPAPTGEPPELAGGDLWLDCLAIPEGNWLCECPIEGSTDTVWRAALCPSNILRAVVWRHAVGLAPTNLPVTLEHDHSRVIGRIEQLYYEAGTGVVARISVTQAGYAEAMAARCDKLSPDMRCFWTNLVIRTDGWVHEHQDYIDARCVPRGEDMTSVTNVPAGVEALCMTPICMLGLSFVEMPLLPTYIESEVREDLRHVYPIRPPRQWSWRNGE